MQLTQSNYVTTNFRDNLFPGESLADTPARVAWKFSYSNANLEVRGSQCKIWCAIMHPGSSKKCGFAFYSTGFQCIKQ